MKSSHCPREEEVAAPPAEERRAVDLKAHLATCAICTEVEEATALLRSAAAADGADRLPDPSVIWRRHYVEERLAERRYRHRRGAVLLRTAQRSTAMIVVSGLTLLASQQIRLLTQTPADELTSPFTAGVTAAAILAAAFIAGVLRHGIRI